MKPREELIEIARSHAAAEGRNDLDVTLATLEGEPVYELQPVGRVLRGKVAARAYYDHFFAHFRPLVQGFELRGEWVTDEGVGQEYVIAVRTPEGSVERHLAAMRLGRDQIELFELV
jgi:hypothetical protein